MICMNYNFNVIITLRLCTKQNNSYLLDWCTKIFREKLTQCLKFIPK